VGSSPIVGVASSAGDLEAVCELLSALPAECAATFIIVQHVDLGREKALLETLARRTTLAVVQAHDGAAMEQEHVYVIGANTTLTVDGARLRVTSNPKGLNHPGDVLFSSLARDHGHDAIGVVLSGEGSDGALGLSAIQRAGGKTLAQYPGSARFPGMPISAIDTGCVGLVLRPNELAQELARPSGYTLTRQSSLVEASSTSFLRSPNPA
jgi:two-component system CheB/CheR fusion protein